MITVLIVEDDPLIAEAHRTYLSRLEGFSLIGVAATAREGMRIAAEAGASDSPVDLVLLDLGLPDANGITLASALSGLRPAPDIIAITSERDLEMVRTAVSLYSRRSATASSATAATEALCRPVPRRPVKPRSTGRWPSCGSAPTGRRRRRERRRAPTTRSPARSAIAPGA